MNIKQIFDKDIAHSSYILWASKSCAVIDPSRDVESYTGFAIERGLKITHILLTHLHADFICGHLELARKTGADIYISRASGCLYNYIGLKEDDVIDIEYIRLKAVETPGHTPEMINYIAYDMSRSKDSPVALFSGDTLFVDDVGRPDIFKDRAEELAGSLYKSLYEKIKRIDDHTEVYPAHGAGSLCGKSIGKKRSTTIGYEKKNNHLLNIDSSQDFKKSLLCNMAPAPAHFSILSEKNRKGPALLEELSFLAPVGVKDVARSLEDRKTVLCDIRRYDAFGAAHIKGSLNIDASDNLTVYGGTFISQDSDVLLLCAVDSDALRAFKLLRRIGIDGNIHYIQGGIGSYISAGYPTETIDIIDGRDFKKMRDKKADLLILDVRNKDEYKKMHFSDAINIPLRFLNENLDKIPKDKRMVVHCSSGIRSGIAVSILKREGFDGLFNLAGGINAYAGAGFSL
jgi:rhodanese-related sulfurtransferase/glyoxylase-like metal-dependent hydrolase (beta-lactamase superfamily II)